jgi:hypothetical protein
MPAPASVGKRTQAIDCAAHAAIIT